MFSGCAPTAPSRRLLIGAFDKGTLKEYIKLGILSDDAIIPVTLYPPKKSISLEHLRSDKRQAIVNASARKHLEGKAKRKYRCPIR